MDAPFADYRWLQHRTVALNLAPVRGTRRSDDAIVPL